MAKYSAPAILISELPKDWGFDSLRAHFKMSFKNKRDYFFRKGYLKIFPELFFAFGTGLFISGFVSSNKGWAIILGIVFLIIFAIFRGIELSGESFELAMLESIRETLDKNNSKNFKKYK